MHRLITVLGVKRTSILFILVLFALIASISVDAEVTTCSSCSDCTSKLNGSYDTVTLTADITDHDGTCIPFGASNVEFDCQGHMIDGDDSNLGFGISMGERSNNTIRNCLVTDFGYGISLERSSYNTLTNNTVSNNDNGIYIYNYNSKYNNLTSNTVSNNGNGIYLWGEHSTLINNTFVNDGLYIYDLDLHQNVIENNTVNGKQLIYLVDVSNQVVEEAGQIILVRCNNIIIEGLTLSNTSIGIELWGTDNCLIFNNTANSNNDYGIYIKSSSDNTLTNNTVSNNDNGIYLLRSSYNTLINNTASNNRNGICLDYLSTSNILNSNQICSNTELDFYVATDPSANSGDENTCDSAGLWNDTGTTGCTYSCSAETTTTTSTSTTTTTIPTTSTTTTTTSSTTTTISSPVTVTRDLPSIIYPAGTTEITLSLVKGNNPPSSIIIYDYMPTGWTVTYSNPTYSELDPDAGFIKWTLWGGTCYTRNLTYRLQVPANASGTAEFGGQYLYNDPGTGDAMYINTSGDTTAPISTETTTSTTTTTTTSTTTTSTTLIPLYCTDYDNGIKTDESSRVEFTSDGTSVETEYDSCTDSTTVLEWYCFGTSAQSIEITCSGSCSGGMCVSGTTSTTSGTTTTSSTTTTTTTIPAATATRTLPETAAAGSSVNVSIALDVNETSKPNSVIIKDYFPAGWNVTGSNPTADGVNYSTSEIKWILVGEDVFDMVISYVLGIPAEEMENGTFSGGLLYNDPQGDPVTVEVGGDSAIVVEVDCLQGDEDCDGTVSDFELLDYVDQWVNGLVGDFDLLEAIDNWAA